MMEESSIGLPVPDTTMRSSRRQLLAVAFFIVAATGGVIYAVAARQRGEPIPAPEEALAGSDQAKPVDLFGDPLPPGARSRIGTIRLRTLGETNRICISPDGKVLVTYRDYEGLRVWDATSGLEIRTIRTVEYEFSHRVYREKQKTTEIVQAMAFASDSRRLNVLSANGVLRTCDVTDGKWSEPLARTTRPEPDEFGRIEAAGNASPDGTHFTYTRFEEPSSRVEVFAIGKDKPILQIEDPELGSWGRRTQFSPDNKRLAIALGNGSLKVWDIATGRVTKHYRGPDLSLVSYAFSPDWKSLAATFIPRSRDNFFSRPITLVTWDAASEEHRLHIPDWKGVVVGHSPDGKKILSLNILGRDGILLSDAATGREVGALKGHATNHSLLLAFSGDQKRLVTCGTDDQSLIIWNLETEQPALDFDGPRGAIRTLAFSPDGKTVFAATHGEQGSLWDTTTGQRKHRLTADEKGMALSAAFTPDGKYLVVGYGWSGSSTDGNWSARMWSVAEGKIVRHFSGHKDGVHQLAVSRNGKQLATHDRQGRAVYLWDLDTGKPIKKGGFTNNSTARIAFASWGEVIGIAPGEGRASTEIRTTHILGGPSIGEWRKSPQSQIHTLSHDGGFVAMLEELGQLKQIVVRSAATGAVAKGLLAGNVSQYTPVAFSANSQYVAVAGHTGDNREPLVHVYEMQTGREIRTLRGHRGSATALAFTPDGKRLVTGSSDSTVLIWDLTTQP